MHDRFVIMDTAWTIVFMQTKDHLNTKMLLFCFYYHYSLHS